jgi:uncharacterized protein (TIGR02001 family)
MLVFKGGVHLMRLLFRSPITRTCLSALALSASAISQPAAGGDWTSSLALTSDYLVHGLRRSADEPAAQAHLGFVGERGWSTGVWASTVNLHPGRGPRQELDFYAAAYAQLSRDWRLTSQLTHYEFLNDSRFLSYDYTEIAATASFRDVLSATIALAPRYSFYSNGIAARNRMAVNYEISGSWPLTRNVQLTAGLGHADLQNLFQASHWYWSGGAELAWKRMRLGVSYVGTDSSAERLFGPKLAANTWVATLAYRLL